MDDNEIANRFTYHPPTTDARVKAHEAIRENCMQLADVLNNYCVEGREKSLAVTKLEEVMFWANASIARQS